VKQLVFILSLALVLVSCGTDSRHFKIEGRFLNLNQGEVYIYSLDGGSTPFDTIIINGGRFSKEVTCEEPQTLVMVFPNYSEQPIFARPGKSVDIKADASHLKEMEVKGTSDNELMTAFRKQTSTLSPPETQQAAEKMINDNPESPVSLWLLRKYFILSQRPDYEKAAELIDKLQKEGDTDNAALSQLKESLKAISSTTISNPLPSYAGYDSRGKYVNLSSVNGKIGVINVWSTWNYESQNTQRRLKALLSENPGKIEIISICIEADKKECNNSLERDGITWSNICDGLLFDSPVVKKLGIRGVPDNILVDKNGRIADRDLSTDELINAIKRML
jgi:AhpC/TSA family.